MIIRGRWHGKHCYFGFHHDLHVDERDAEIGARCGPDELVPMLRLAGAEFVQTDSKGHHGYTSWLSRNPQATVAPGIVKDPLLQWREATRQIGIPLHCHDSGIWDSAAGLKHPEWSIITADGTPALGVFAFEGHERTPGALMCPRSPYLDQLMIPQMFEMIDRYGADGFWIDGDVWAMQPCYCPRCRQAFTEETGIADPPTDSADTAWPEWREFTRRSFETYLTKYCDAVHQHKPGALVCSNWLQTFQYPGEPTAPTDWISGDNTPVWGLDGSRCQARFISTRGKPWDIMLWDFYPSHGLFDANSPWVTKPVQMLQQEAAVVTAFGGNVQACDPPWAPCGLRNGQHVPWRMKRVREMGRFVKARRSLCQDTDTFPQVAVLHSEHHLRGVSGAQNVLWNMDTAPVEGAVYSLLENHYGVDVLDEWALIPRISEFPVVVVPEQSAMSEQMVQALKDYVRKGGKLLATGSGVLDRLGEEFIGAVSRGLTEKTVYHLPAADGATPVYSETWRMIEPTTATELCLLGTTPLIDEYLIEYSGAVLNRRGRGRVLYVPGDLFREFAVNRYPLTRSLVGELMRKLCGRLEIDVQAPVCVDVVLRRKGRRTIIHLINRASGIPNQPQNGAVDEIPPVGPITIAWLRPTPPSRVRLAFEKSPLGWEHSKGVLRVTVPSVHIHSAVVVE